MECRKEIEQIVFPVFYHVDPTNVRKHTGSFGEAFSIHERNVEEEKEQRWRAAMTEASNLRDCLVNDGYVWKYIKEIIDAILKRLDPKLFHVDDDIVGMHLHLKELKSLINSHLHGVHVVGIYRTGGIGKTIIAKLWLGSMELEELVKLPLLSLFIKRFNGSHLHDVRVVGIYGTGGIGKTAIAKLWL